MEQFVNIVGLAKPHCLVASQRGGSVGYVPVSGTILGVLSAEKKRQKRIIQMREKVKTYNTAKNMGTKKRSARGGYF